MTNQEIDAVMAACAEWVRQHHRTDLTVQEASAIRVKLKERLHSKFHPEKPDLVELVQLAHHLANSAVDRRRDAAELRRSA